MALRLEKIERIHLHTEITTRFSGTDTFNNTEREVAPIAMPDTTVPSTAFLACQMAAKDFIPQEDCRFSNDDDPASGKFVLGTSKSAHHIAFMATQTAVVDFNFADFVLPI